MSRQHLFWALRCARAGTGVLFAAKDEWVAENKNEGRLLSVSVDGCYRERWIRNIQDVGKEAKRCEGER